MGEQKFVTKRTGAAAGSGNNKYAKHTRAGRRSLLASMIETASSAGKGGATICDRSCSRASGRRKKTRRSGIVHKRWEQYMPSRTDNDIKNRWNSVIRKAHAPGGRELEAAENEMRALFLGSASRTQSRKKLGGMDRRRLRASGEAKKTSKLPKPSPESPSPPAPGRKLFDSPLGVGTDGEEVHTPAPSRSQLADAVEVQLVTTEDVHDVLLEGEISAETFDVEAFLPESYAAGTLSALSSPMNACGVQFTPSRRRGITWYD